MAKEVLQGDNGEPKENYLLYRHRPISVWSSLPDMAQNRFAADILFISLNDLKYIFVYLENIQQTLAVPQYKLYWFGISTS